MRLLLAALLLVLVAGCGGSDDEPKASAPKSPAAVDTPCESHLRTWVDEADRLGDKLGGDTADAAAAAVQAMASATDDLKAAGCNQSQVDLLESMDRLASSSIDALLSCDAEIARDECRAQVSKNWGEVGPDAVDTLRSELD